MSSSASSNNSTIPCRPHVMESTERDNQKELRIKWREDGLCLKCGETRTETRVLCLLCQLTKTRHPQVLTKYGFPVDEDLLAIITTLNDLGLMTKNSCQANTSEQVVWIQFRSLDSLKMIKSMSSKQGSYNIESTSWRFPRYMLPTMEKLVIDLGSRVSFDEPETLQE